MFFKKNKTNDGAPNLKGKYNHDWVEESFNFERSSGKQVKISQTKDYLGKSVDLKKISFFSLIIILGIFIILIKIFYLQILKGEHYRGLAEGNRIRIKPVISERGVIFDKKGNELVQNVPNFSLALVPQDVPKEPKKRDEVIKKVEELSGVSKSQIVELLERYRAYSYASIVIKENLDYESALRLYIESSRMPGISIEKGSKRQYSINVEVKSNSSTISLSHILGYLGKLDEKQSLELKNNGYLLADNIGKMGLEKYYEKELRGKYGNKKVEVDAFGHEQTILSENAPVPGQDLKLTLDLEAQRKLESLLEIALKKTGTQKAIGVVIEPNNGAIIALVSLPTFDVNKFSGGISQEDYRKYSEDPNNPLFNRAIAGTYPSGSTIKLVVSVAALEENIVTPGTTVLSTGGLTAGGRLFKDWSLGGHGVTNMVKAIAWSVNTYFYYIGGGYKKFTGLGADKLIEYMKLFGLAKKTGIDLSGEAEGFLPSKEWKKTVKGESWFIGDTYNLSIGQGDLLVTPIQVALWTSAVATGKIIKPHLVDVIIDQETKKATKIKYETANLPVSGKNLAVVRAGMKACVEYGSCQQLRGLAFSSAGKTGTAQWSSNKNNHAWFTAFAPFESPRVVITILIEEGGEGSIVAQPVARDFLIWWNKQYNS
ncbi:MAG: penicillin-binding protein 2 [Patescibacteria group bacterium]|mgnify:CR=1 FL=1